MNNIYQKKIKKHVALENNEEKLKIIWDLRHSLLEINVEYEVKQNFDNLESIIIKKTIYFDGLSKNKFMDTRFVLIRGFNLVQLMLVQLRENIIFNSTNTKLM